MAWLKIDESLPSHFKTLKAAQKLGVSKFEMMGVMVSLWLWSLQNLGPEGQFPEEDFNIILQGIGWNGDPELLLSALSSCGRKGNGFVVKSGEGNLALNSWREWTGNLMEQRETNKKRAAINREKNRTRTVREPYANDTCTVRESYDTREEQSREELNHIAHPPDAPGAKCATTARGDAPHASPHASDDATLRTKRGRNLTGAQLEMFLRFWETFANKKGKAAAADSWIDAHVTEDMMNGILESAAREAQGRGALRAKGRTPIYPQGWIVGRRWEDEAEPAAEDSEDFDPTTRPRPEITPELEELLFEPYPEEGETI